MNNIKKFALGLMVAAFAFSFSAFTANQKLTIEQWHFKSGQMLSNADNPASYEQLSSIPTPSCDGEEVLPCVVEFDNQNPSTPDLASYLATFPNDAAIAADAVSKREN
jgi:hypothetical protein